MTTQSKDHTAFCIDHVKLKSRITKSGVTVHWNGLDSQKCQK